MVTSGSQPAIVLYDGVCALCAGVVRFVLPRDRGGRFRFAAIQSGFAQEILARHGRSATALDTFCLVEGTGTPGERILDRSTAALALATALGGAWRLLAVFWIVPRPIRDLAYRLVARYRYRVFGRSEACMRPDPRWADRFIDAG